MPIESHFIHTCTIQRATETLDAYQNKRETWATVASNVPCRLVEKQQRLVNSERVESTVVTTHLLLIGSGANVLERDRVSQVRLEDGTVVNMTFVVKSLVMRRAYALNHKSAALSVIE